MGHDVLTLGEAMVLLYPDEPVSLGQGSRVTLGIAGTESNTAIQLSRLGHCVHFISRVGKDPFGQRIRETLSREEVDMVGLLSAHTAKIDIFFREWLPGAGGGDHKTLDCFISLYFSNWHEVPRLPSTLDSVCLA